MEYIRIRQISEADFDSLIVKAGGQRIPDEGSADYILNEAVIELKLLEEEGFEKSTRRAKIAKIFREKQPSAPTVIVDPELLDVAGKRAYQNAVGGPIQTAIKKAASQLDGTRIRVNQNLVRVLVILNIGYTSLSEEEFKSICIKCVLNDTTRIDWIVCGGIYYYSDKFDSYIISPLQGMAVNVQCAFPSLELLQKEWGQLVEAFMTETMREPGPLETGKMPVLDLAFELDGVRYVRPSPRMPKSKFWPKLRSAI